MEAKANHYALWLGLAVCVSGTAWANVEPDDCMDDATETGIVHCGGHSYFEELDPIIGDGPCPEYDVDLYKFVITCGTPCVLICEVTRDDEEPLPPESLDSYIILWDENGNEVLWADDYECEGGCRANDSLLVCCFQPGEEGTYYIGVSSLVGQGRIPPDYDPGVPCTQGVNYSQGPYDIIIEVYSAAGLGGPWEPNNTIQDAHPINLGQAYDAYVGDGDWGNSSGDYDWYQFDVPLDCSLITVRVQTDTVGSDLDAVVNLYDPSCWVRTQAIHFDPHQALDGEQECPGDTICQWIVANAGTYYAAVHGYGTGSQQDNNCDKPWAGGGVGSTGAYRMTVTVDGPGTYPNPTDPVTEPNDWIANATSVPMQVCGDCWSLEDAFIGDGPCGCWPGDETRGGDFDVYEVYVPTGCELLVCLETVDREENDSQADLAMIIWIADGSDWLVFGMGDPICDGQCMWFCSTRSTEYLPDPNNFYLVVGGINVPTDIATPDANCEDESKRGVTGVGYYNIYMSLEPYLVCQPTAYTDLCPEEGCAGGYAYLLRSHYYCCPRSVPLGEKEYDCMVADDFIVPQGEVWRICDIHAHFRAMFSYPTISTVPTQLIFRIYDTDPELGCDEDWYQDPQPPPPNELQPLPEHHYVPNRASPLWEYTVTGFVNCSRIYDCGWINLFSNSTKRSALCTEDSCDGGFIQLCGGTAEEGTRYWLSVVGVHEPTDCNVYGWFISNRPGEPCCSGPSGMDAQWKYNEGWLQASPPPVCGADWTGQWHEFINGEIGHCPYDLAWKLTGEVVTCCTTCIGDMPPDCDGVVNVTDFTQFAMAYLSQCGDPNYDLCADVAPPGSDGFVNVTDFTAWAISYPGPCP